MLGRLMAVLSLVLALALPAHAQITRTSPGVSIASYALGCIPKATSSTGLDCSPLSIDASTLAQRNGTNAQRLLLYRTYTDDSNGSWLEFDANANGNAYIGTNKNGTGVAGPLYFLTGGTSRWSIDVNGHLVAATDNTYDIGASGATRPRNIYAAGTITAGGAVNASVSGFNITDVGGNGFKTTNGGFLIFTAAGRLKMMDNTAAAGALWNTATVDKLTLRNLADSADGTLQVGTLLQTATSSPAATDACTAGTITHDTSYIYVCIASGNWGRSALTTGY